MDEAVAQFAEVTGATPHIAQQYLQLFDNNLEAAVPLYFENEGADMAAATEPQAHHTDYTYEDDNGVVHIDSSDESTPHRVPTFEDDDAMARRLQAEADREQAQDGVRAPMGRRTETLVGSDADEFGVDPTEEAIMAQIRARQARRGRAGIFNQRETSIWSDNDSSHRSALAQATGGQSESSSRASRLAEMYRPPFEIISRLPWDAARIEGRDTEKWLLVNVQDPSIFDCQLLNRDLWKSPGVMETVRENFIFLQWQKGDPLSTPYVQYYFSGYQIDDNYPHIAIVDPRTGEQMKVWSGRPVVSANDFLIQLHEFLDRYSLKTNVRNPIPKRKPQPEKKIETMTEDEMLEIAMKNSLEGHAGAASKPVDPDELTKNGPEGGELSVEEAKYEDYTPEHQAFVAIPTDRPHVEPPPDPTTVTRIQFRHPSGRVIRRFALAEPVRRLYEWLKAEPIEADKQGVEFELVAMGQNLINSLDVSVQDAGLKNGTVMVGYVSDD